MRDGEATAFDGLATRRSFLRYVGAGAASAVGAHLLGPLMRSAAAAPATVWTRPDGAPAWWAVSYPIPAPGDGGSALDDPVRFAHYGVEDDLLLPVGFRWDVVAQWGERFGPANDPAQQIIFGYNCDYTALIPIPNAKDEYWLVVNHEYISAKPWLQGYERARGHALAPYKLDNKDRGKPAGVALEGPFDLQDEQYLKNVNPRLITAIREICRAGLEDLGISILRVRQNADGTIHVLREARDHRRITALSRRNIDDPRPIRAGGPAASIVQDAPGTFANCSGAVTPWGTVLTCEENFQDQVMEFITPGGKSLPGARKPFAGMEFDPKVGLPFEFEGLGQGVTPMLDGRHFGWVCEVDPATGVLEKHTALGRFRHENVAIRCEAGRRLAAYMGDDRRGGHLWKYISRGTVMDPLDRLNSALLRDGVLYVAKLNADYTGQWIPITPETRLAKPEPETCAGEHLWLPKRPEGGHVVVRTPTAKALGISAEEWIASIEKYAGKPYAAVTLGDLVRAEPPLEAAGVLVMDAYVFGNCAGGTPSARPEDIEIHPLDRSVYIAFTDSTGNADGSPDKRVFPDSAGANSRQYGAIYRIIEDNDDPASLTFRWGRFVTSGEAFDGGGAFACADNLAFDPAGNMWLVCDMTTAAHNAAVDRTDLSAPGAKNFLGVFGNNSMFMIPTAGAHAGVPHCFAIGPMECELTGPTFTGDGRALLLSVQHPGEFNGARGLIGGLPSEEARQMKLAARDGKTFTQSRIVPIGSNFPSRKRGEHPRSCVVCIARK